jgi:hypothetical protein
MSDEIAPQSESTETPPPAQRNFLTDVELDLVFYIERFHSSTGNVPSNNDIRARFSNVSDQDIAEFKNNPLVIRSMGARGIPFPDPGEQFSQRQMAAAATMLAYTDRRSDEKKLRDIGVTPREWAGWLQDEKFASYLRDRSEKMAEHSIHEAHLGLIKGVRSGNTASIKLFLEMQGRYNPEQENQINVRLLLHKFIEVIQKHVRDPLVLHNIARELSAIATDQSFGQALGRTIIQGDNQFGGQIHEITSAPQSAAPMFESPKIGP